MPSTVASLVQYPLPCPKCKAYTSKDANKLIRDQKITCRLCANVIRLTDQQMKSLERTLQHMSVCGSRVTGKELTEKLEVQEEELID